MQVRWARGTSQLAAGQRNLPTARSCLGGRTAGGAGAGAWPAAVVVRLAGIGIGIAERCIAYHPRPRAAVRDVLGELEELAQVRRSDSDSARKLVVAEQRLRLFI